MTFANVIKSITPLSECSTLAEHLCAIKHAPVGEIRIFPGGHYEVAYIGKESNEVIYFNELLDVKYGSQETYLTEYIEENYEVTYIEKEYKITLENGRC